MVNIVQDLLDVAKVLHWLGKYREANAITDIAMWLVNRGVATEEGLTILLDSLRLSDAQEKS